MKLSQAMRIVPGECIAFSGAGGKSTALFTLAKELPGPVVVTTTTHFSLDQLSLADNVQYVNRSTETNEIFENLKDGVILLRGELVGQDKVAGIPEDKLEELFHAARERGITILIEADGSRQLPVKAPATHEPVIPAFVDQVVVVTGLTGLGKPLNENWVHRVDQFAKISGLDLGEPVTQSTLIEVLKDPDGGLKGIPTYAKRIALLNQADDPGLQALGNWIAKRLADDYDAVIVASLMPSGEHTENLRGDQKTSIGIIFAAHQSIAAIILAAGQAERMGRTKQLLPWKGKPLIWHVAQAASDEWINEVIIVIGAKGELVKESLSDLDVQFVNNPDWQLGQSTSLKAGLSAVPKWTGAAIFLLADQPQISPTLINALIERHAVTLAPIVAPLIDGKRGNPVLFDRITFDELMKVQGDQGGRKIFSRHPVEWVEWHDDRALVDIDTEVDYQNLLDGDF